MSYAHVEDIITTLRGELPPEVTLVAVSKFHPIEAIEAAVRGGQEVFGESRAQELAQKYAALPHLKWHFIGHLQSNKVRAVVPYVSLIHSVDSVALLHTIDKEAARIGRVVDVLLQLHVAQETTKFGLTCDECVALAASGVLTTLGNVKVRGVMGMATNTDDSAEIAAEFKKIRSVFDTLKSSFYPSDDTFSVVSMGMSHDYKIAIDCGSNMVRIGTTIFGEREY